MNAQQIQFNIPQEVSAERRLKDWLLALSGEFIQLRPDMAPEARAWQRKLKADWETFQGVAQMSRTGDSVLVEAFRTWDADKSAAARELRHLATEGEAQAVLNALETRVPHRKRDPKNPLMKPGAKSLPPVRSTSQLALMRFTNDRVHSATVRSAARVDEWGPLSSEKLAFGLSHDFNNVQVAVGLPEGEKAETLWGFLRGGGAKMVKAHYALWARYYEQATDGAAREFVVVSVPEFCSDMDLEKHQKGGYEAPVKRAAMKMLETLTTVEISCTFTLPNGSKNRMRGPLWSRGIVGEKLDQYEDEAGARREGDPAKWEPVGFSFAPGPWYENPEWRKHNRYVGKIGSGLMKLQTNTDQWAILIGGYLGAQARVGRYKPLRFRIETVLRETGLAQTARAKKNLSETRAKLEKALDKLVENGVIASWNAPEWSADEVEDFDDVEALSDYGAQLQQDAATPRNWRAGVLDIAFPLDDDRARLEALSAQKKRKRATGKGARKRD